LTDAERPLTVAEVLLKTQATIPSLNEATVYRNLRSLIEEGHLTQLAHPEAGALFERADQPHHHHFFCRQCLLVFNLPGCPLDKAKRKLHGFIAEGHEIFYRGLCRRCATVKSEGVKA
jgi:Fur family transcriptional regulator, ferric uptake regulator